MYLYAFSTIRVSSYTYIRADINAFLQWFLHTMAQSTSFIAIVAPLLITALFISTLSYCSAEKVYCVTPTVTSCSSCPHNLANCTTLSEYAQEAELYLTSSATMVFLPGGHVLNMNITVANVTSMESLPQATEQQLFAVSQLVSASQAWWSWKIIYSLDFTSCSRLLRYAITVPGFPLASVSVVLDLQSTQHTELVN